MFYVYVLKDRDGNLYKGMTSNLESRLKEHKSGKTKTTRKMDGIEIVYQEAYSSPDEARKREVYFKTAAGRKFLKTKI